MQKEESNLIELIEAQQQETAEGLEELRKARLIEEQRIKSNRQYESYKWQCFKNIVNGKQYFRMAHIDKLNIKQNILIHLSAKNCGKTTEIYRIMKDCIQKGEKFIYGRVYVQEMHAAVSQFEMDENSPCLILRKDNRFYFYKKDDIYEWQKLKKRQLEDEDENTLIGYPRIIDLQKMGCKPVGLGFTFVNSNTLGGMNYDGFTTIFFDEILSYSPINRINKRVLDAWDASLSTITRKKPDMKIIMMGNLLDVPEHPILKFYGIDIDDNLRIIKRGDNGECTILFINSGGLYTSSFKNQAGVTKHGDLEHQAFLKNNKILKPSTNILSPQLFEKFNYELAFAMELLDGAYLIYLKRATEIIKDENNIEQKKDVFCVYCDQLTISTQLNGAIYTDNPNIINKYENTTRRESLISMFNNVYRLYKHRLLKFESVSSMSNYAKIVKQYQSYIYGFGGN